MRPLSSRRAAGALVLAVDEVLESFGPGLGKGDALWRSLAASSGDLVVWCDGDIVDFGSQFVYGLIGPLLTDDRIEFVKGAFDRPARGALGGGRVTQLLARPLLALLRPELSFIEQPLSGSYAGRRSTLEQLCFEVDFGVDVGLLMDVADFAGCEAIAQVFLGEFRHQHRCLDELSTQADSVARTILERGNRLAAADTPHRRPPLSTVGRVEGAFELVSPVWLPLARRGRDLRAGRCSTNEGERESEPERSVTSTNTSLAWNAGDGDRLPKATSGHVAREGAVSARKERSTVSALVIVANRLPVQAPTRGRGPWTRSPGGLAEALHRTLEARGGTWIGWPGGRSTTGLPTNLGYDLHPVPLDAADLRGYYDGFANATLWPLYHDLIRPPVVPPRLVGRLRPRQPTFRRRGRRRPQHPAPLSGSTTITCSSCRRSSASADRTFASASSSTSRSRPLTSSLVFRGEARCSTGSRAPT